MIFIIAMLASGMSMIVRILAGSALGVYKEWASHSVSPLTSSKISSPLYFFCITASATSSMMGSVVLRGARATF